MKKSIVIFSVLFLSIITFFTLKNSSTKNNLEKEVVNYKTRVLFDQDIPEELIGAYHYAMICTINNKVTLPNSAEEHKIELELDDGRADIIGFFPNTSYSATVEEVIKGNVNEGETIYLEEAYQETYDAIYSVLSREHLQEGNTYLIFARRDKQESEIKVLTVGTVPNSTQLINKNLRNYNSVKDDLLSFYSEAYENEIIERADISNDTAYNSFEELE